MNPNKDNQFKDLRTAKTKLHNVTISKSFKKRKFDLNSEDEDEKIPDVLQHKGAINDIFFELFLTQNFRTTIGNGR